MKKQNQFSFLKQGVASLFTAMIVATLLVFASVASAEAYDVRGKTKGQIRSIYGEPISIKGPIGGYNQKRPPITEWDYGTFYITFERNIALHGNDRGSLQLNLN